MAMYGSLDYLLDLNGETLVQEGGYWIKIEARRCERSPQMPHGISYSLTLHEPYGSRVLGFHNAHAVPKMGNRFSARRIEFDHWHPDGRTIAAYRFIDPGQLLEDFFAAVDRVLKNRGVI